MSGPAPAATRRARRSLALLVAAHAAATAGNAVTVFTTPFFVRSLGGSASEIGLATALAAVPVVVGGPLGGVLVDRLGHRRSSLVSDAVSGSTVLLIPVLAAAEHLSMTGFLVLIVLSGFVDTPGQTARTVLLPALARAAGAPLTRAVGLLTGAERTALLVGAPLAGWLVASVGPAAAFAVDAGFFAVSTALVAAVPAGLAVAPPRTASPEGAPAAPGYWRDLAEGLRFVRSRPLLRDLALVVLVLNVLDAARFSVLLPLVAIERFGGAGAAGVLTGVLAAGMVLGTAVFSTWGHRLPRRAVFVVCAAIAGGPLSAALAADASFAVVVALAAVTGLFAGALNPLIGVLRLESTPPHLLARVQTLMIAVAWLGIPAGSLLGGVATDRFGPSAVLWVLAAVAVLTALVPLTDRSWRTADARA